MDGSDTAAPAADAPRPAITVMSPGLLASVTIELSSHGTDEIHFHPAGQGFWVARALNELGADATLCCVRGGEAAAAAVELVDEGITVRHIDTDVPTGAYVDDRRDGDRTRIAAMKGGPLDRHTVDDLIGIVIAEGLRTKCVILTGSNESGSVQPALYTTLSSSLHALGATVVVDLSGAELHAALAGHVDAVKVSHTELLQAGFGTADDFESLREAARRVADISGADVFVTRADEGALVHTLDGTLTGKGPTLDIVEPRGAGDSFTAAVALARLVGLDAAEQLRMAMATAASNVLRRGLGSATADAVHAIGMQIEVVPA
jgi:1-phosphofructokinase